jgi:hypothetical protein
MLPHAREPLPRVLREIGGELAGGMRGVGVRGRLAGRLLHRPRSYLTFV